MCEEQAVAIVAFVQRERAKKFAKISFVAGSARANAVDVNRNMHSERLTTACNSKILHNLYSICIWVRKPSILGSMTAAEVIEEFDSIKTHWSLQSRGGQK